MSITDSKFIYNDSLADPDAKDAKYAVIIDHFNKKLLVHKYSKMYLLVNQILRASRRYTIHRILGERPTQDILHRYYYEIFG